MSVNVEIAQEQCGDSPVNTQMFEEDTSALDMLAASVLLFIKRDESCSPPPSNFGLMSPSSKRKQTAEECYDSPNSPTLGDSVVVTKKYKKSSSEDELGSDDLYHPHSNKGARLPRSSSQEFDSEFEYEHAGEEEEDYLMEEDDDEWSDGRFANFAGPLSPIDRAPRKKAPSGTACEKHKRWKKRCPEDCPMRKNKSKKSKIQPRSPRAGDLKDDVSLLQWSFDQMNTEGQSSQEDLESSDSNMGGNDSEPETYKTVNHPKLRTKSRSTDDLMFDDLIKSNNRKQTPKRSRGTRKYLPQACDRHKLLHAKCPANCPDRLKRDADLARKKNDGYLSQPVI